MYKFNRSTWTKTIVFASLVFFGCSFAFAQNVNGYSTPNTLAKCSIGIGNSTRTIYLNNVAIVTVARASLQPIANALIKANICSDFTQR